MERPSENVWRLIEKLRSEGVSVGIILRPDNDPRPPIAIRLPGSLEFEGHTFQEVALQLGRSRCWEREVELEVLPPADQSGPRRAVRIDDILSAVAKVAMQFGRPFRADEVADYLWIHPSAAAGALKKLEWPRLPKKVKMEIEGRVFDVYMYAPKNT